MSDVYCSKCGAKIDDEAIACPTCGVATANYRGRNERQQPIIINNSSSSSSSASATAFAGRVRRHHNLLLDLILICCTGGLWIIWMICRPKYY